LFHVLPCGEEVLDTVSLLMLAVVALFPVSLLAILLLTSGLEGRMISSESAETPVGGKHLRSRLRSRTRTGTRS